MNNPTLEQEIFVILDRLNSNIAKVLSLLQTVIDATAETKVG